MALGRAAGDVECEGGVVDRQTREEPELHEFGDDAVFLFQFVQDFMHRDEFLVIGFRDDVDAFEIHALHVAAVFQGLLAPGVVHQDPAHGLGGGGEEVSSVFPFVVAVGNAQPRFVHQGGGLQGLAG